MAESIDSLQRAVTKLSQILVAQQSGLPNRVVVILRGAQAITPALTEQAIKDRISAFGLLSVDDLSDAGSELVTVSLPWLASRSVGHVSKTNIASMSINLVNDS